MENTSPFFSRVKFRHTLMALQAAIHLPQYSTRGNYRKTSHQSSNTNNRISNHIPQANTAHLQKYHGSLKARHAMTSEPIHCLNFSFLFYVCHLLDELLNWTLHSHHALCYFTHGEIPLLCLSCSEYREADHGDRARVSKTSHLNNLHLGISCTGMGAGCYAGRL